MLIGFGIFLLCSSLMFVAPFYFWLKPLLKKWKTFRNNSYKLSKEEYKLQKINNRISGIAYFITLFTNVMLLDNVFKFFVLNGPFLSFTAGFYLVFFIIIFGTFVVTDYLKLYLHKTQKVY